MLHFSYSIAGVPIGMGLLAETFPLIVYALFGTSKYLSVGAVSIVFLLAFSGIYPLEDIISEQQFLEVMVLLCLLIGIVQLMIGVLKVGSLVKYISRAVIGSFTSALAIIIIFNQMSTIMGGTLSDYQNVSAFIFDIIDNIPKANFLTVMMGIGSFSFLILLKRKLRISPGPFIFIFISIFAPVIF